MAGIAALCQPRGETEKHLGPTATSPRRPKQAKGPTSTTVNRARHPDQDAGPATSHNPTSKGLGHTCSNTLPNAHRHRCTAPT